MTWQMFAGRDERNGGFRNIGHRRYVEMYGHDPVAVTVTEDPDGPYFGWLRAATSWSEAVTEPSMIQQHEGIFGMQFPYGYEAEVKAGRGRVVKLSIVQA